MPSSGHQTVCRHVESRDRCHGADRIHFPEGYVLPVPVKHYYDLKVHNMRMLKPFLLDVQYSYSKENVTSVAAKKSGCSLNV